MLVNKNLIIKSKKKIKRNPKNSIAILKSKKFLKNKLSYKGGSAQKVASQAQAPAKTQAQAPPASSSSESIKDLNDIYTEIIVNLGEAKQLLENTGENKLKKPEPSETTNAAEAEKVKAEKEIKGAFKKIKLKKLQNDITEIQEAIELVTDNTWRNISDLIEKIDRVNIKKVKEIFDKLKEKEITIDISEPIKTKLTNLENLRDELIKVTDHFESKKEYIRQHKTAKAFEANILAQKITVDINSILKMVEPEAKIKLITPQSTANPVKTQAELAAELAAATTQAELAEQKQIHQPFDPKLYEDAEDPTDSLYDELGLEM